jgi:hypothetical protein
MKKKYDKSKESIFLEYLGADNLYGTSVCNYLPYGSFKWPSTDVDVMNIPDDCPMGYILEVDLFYPK